MRDVPDPLAGTWERAGEDRRYWMTRVLDAATFEPVTDARMYVDYEVSHTVPRFADPIRVAHADEYGWIRLRVDPGDGNWFYVDAPGYGPKAELGGTGDTTYLRKEIDVPVEVKDPLGRPIPHAAVAYYHGCGHTPDTRRIRTDARGRGSIPAIDPWEGIFWPVGAGTEARDWWARNWEPWLTPCVMVGPPGVVVEGVVLGDDVEPLAGAYVGDTAWNHGPWTRTDERGRFRLVGVEPFDWVSVDRTDDEYDRSKGFVAPPSGRSVVYRAAGPGARFATTVRVEESEGGTESDFVEEVLVYAVRDGDGFTAKVDIEIGNRAVLQLPRGEYDLVADGRLGTYGTVRTRLRVPAPAPVVMRVPRNPKRPVDATRLRKEDDVFLVSALFECEVTEEARKGAIPVPEDVETVLQVRRWERTAVRIVRWPESGTPVRLEGPPPATLRLRVVGPDGKRAAVTLRHDELEVVAIDGVCVWPSYGMGCDEIEIVPRSPELGARELHVSYPFGGETGADEDLGEIRLRRKGQPPLRVLLPDGTPAAGATVERIVHSDRRPFDLDERGGGDGDGWGEPREGDAIEVQARGLLPYRTVLDGAGPWTVRIPRGGSVVLSVSDGNGSPVKSFDVFVDGEWLDGRDGRFEVAGLSPGRHRVLVAAAGMRAKQWSFVAKEGESHERAIRLLAE
jgi:hypothetical protein